MIHRVCWTAAMAALLAWPAAAQVNRRFELGVKSGAAAQGYVYGDVPVRPSFGVEACIACEHRYALFADYAHLVDPGYSGGYRSAEFFSTGLRIQWRERVRPYFDAGFALGHTRRGHGPGSGAFTSLGLALGGGVRIPIGSRLYLRPQYKIAFKDDGYVAALAEVGIGWRF